MTHISDSYLINIPRAFKALTHSEFRSAFYFFLIKYNALFCHLKCVALVHIDIIRGKLLKFSL